MPILKARLSGRKEEDAGIGALKSWFQPCHLYNCINEQANRYNMYMWGNYAPRPGRALVRFTRKPGLDSWFEHIVFLDVHIVVGVAGPGYPPDPNCGDGRLTPPAP